ncbi:hypothetical protein IV203_031967 [Nitzschia inconspicua]|uniref:Transmembrane protein n=1 Tax=Nitzschia inconspicua TaxID=303405 RepID=A0A9K3Q5L8_9STRA|nr:hypothetical protein IV203_031967 [Nitzschia inconspicua]
MKSFSKSGWKRGGGETTTTTSAASSGGRRSGGTEVARETDPLIIRNSNHSNNQRASVSSSSAATAETSSFIHTSSTNNSNSNSHHNTNTLRERRKSPIPTTTTSMNDPKITITTNNTEPSSSYTRIQDDNHDNNNNNNIQRSRSGNMSLGDNSSIGGPSSSSYQNSHVSDGSGGGNGNSNNRPRTYTRGKGGSRDAPGTIGGGGGGGGGSSSSCGNEHPPLIEIPEEIYAVRKAALQVLKPLTRTWLIVSVGFAMTVLFGMARWTRLLPKLPFWFILLPSWLAHLGLFWCHIASAKALSAFIADANESRQRPDSRDHLDRTEYLPLLQRSLKFGLKTGLISFGVFIFEVLIYFKLARDRLSLTSCLFPMWIMVSGGIVDGIICRTQHFVRVICWALVFTAMVLLCLKVDYGYDDIRWRVVVSPIVVVLTVASATLIYIVYGHQVGYYRLTESQLTAGNLFSLAALISIVLVVVIGEVIPLARPVEIETRVFVVLMAPLVVVLVGMGAWVVSRDEFGRLLLYGGQAQVHPKKLRWEKKGWTTVQGKGVTTIPMFGEVSFRPREKNPQNGIELCACCSCYPYEDDEEELAHIGPEENLVRNHPYLAPPPIPSNAPATSSYPSYMPWQGTATSQTQTV